MRNLHSIPLQNSPRIRMTDVTDTLRDLRDREIFYRALNYGQAQQTYERARAMIQGDPWEEVSNEVQRTTQQGMQRLTEDYLRNIPETQGHTLHRRMMTVGYDFEISLRITHRPERSNRYGS